MKLKQENKVVVLICLGLYVFVNILRFALFPEQPLKWHLQAAVLGLFMVVTLVFSIRFIDLKLDKYFPFERDIPVRIFIQFALTFLVIIILRFIGIPVVINLFGVTPSRDILIASFFIQMFIVASITLAIFGYYFVIRWREAQLHTAELEKEKARVQYDNLKNQLNPHFLFNSLTSLNSLIFENPQLASDFLQQLSKVYRYVLENKERNLVSVETEINFVKHYVQLLKTRFEEGFDVKFEIEEPAKQKAIVPVTLQILIENAMKHNVIQKDSPLIISITAQNGFLLAENNFQKKNVVDSSNGLGLENLRNLYRYLSEREVIIEQTEKSFTVKIPLLEL